MSGASDTPTMIPWGRLADGKIGLNVDDTTGIQKNAVLEVWADFVTATADPTRDFPGRLILATDTGLVYVYDPSSTSYRELGSLPAQVGNAAGNPPVVPTPLDGELYWDLDTKVCFVWDGTRWEPIGGRYAGLFRSSYHPSVNGTDVSFSMGLTAAEIDSIAGSPQNVEAFIDGVRQSVAAGQYVVVGGSVTFLIPPPAGTNVYTRALVSDIIAPTAEVITKFIEADGIDKTFDTGVTGVSRTGTFVYVNGVMQTGPEAGSGVFAIDPDYEIISQDTCITGLTVTNAITGEVTVTTLVAHSAVGGEQTIIENIAAEPLYEGTFSVATVPSPTTFTVINPAAIGGLGPVTDPGPGCTVGMYYTPAFVSDKVQLPYNLADPALPSGAKVLIKAVRNLTTVEASGEVNEGVNIGGGVPVYLSNAGTDLVFRTILAGSNVAISDTGSEVLISATGANTFEDRNGINTTYHLLGATESYIGVLSTSSAVTIDLSSVVDIIDAGRRIVIVDESGGAAINNITIIHGGRTFNGAPNHVINSNYGTVTLVFSGSNWYITSGGTGGGGPSGVSSFAARTGAVIPQSGDYNAIKISYSNGASGLASLDVQNAIDEIALAGAAAVPSGVMAPFAGDASTVPSGWLLCDGKTLGNGVSGAVHAGPQYETLFDIVKTMTGGATPYNTGVEVFAAGTTTKLPDLRGRVPVGPDNMGGVSLGTLATTVEVPETDAPGGVGGADTHTLSPAEAAAGLDVGKQAAAGALDYHTDGGGGAAHNNMPPFQLLNWIVKV